MSEHNRFNTMHSGYYRDMLMCTYHFHMTTAESALRMAWVFGSEAKKLADSNPMMAMEKDYLYAQEMARAIHHLTNARKIRKGV